jgi:hypothetical protein
LVVRRFYGFKASPQLITVTLARTGASAPAVASSAQA